MTDERREELGRMLVPFGTTEELIQGVKAGEELLAEVGRLEAENARLIDRFDDIIRGNTGRSPQRDTMLAELASIKGSE